MIIQTERDLIALALALLPPRLTITAVEQAACRGIRPYRNVSVTNEVRASILSGNDPLGDAFGLSALLGHGYTVDNRAQPEMATFGVFRRRVPPIAMQNRRLPLDHWGQVVVRSDFR